MHFETWIADLFILYYFVTQIAIMQRRHSLSRRKFLQTSGIASIGFLGLQHFVTKPLLGSPHLSSGPAAGYGPLVKDPEGVL
ncbi:MAG TPA: hypothetical protein VD816_16720, partial [Ohtaekwangia sp.]|nr:hypothetical protein [Ohtaekwangia sp.]